MSTVNVNVEEYRQTVVDTLKTIEYAEGVALPVAPFAWSNPQPPLAVVMTGSPFAVPVKGYDFLFRWRVRLYVDNSYEDSAAPDLDAMVSKTLNALIERGYGIVTVAEYAITPTVNTTLLMCEITVSDPNTILVSDE